MFFFALMLPAAPVGAQTVLSIDFGERVVDQTTNTTTIRFTNAIYGSSRFFRLVTPAGP